MTSKTGTEKPEPDVMRPEEVAAYWRVSVTTVAGRAQAGKLPCFRTPGGHRRYRRSDVVVLFESAGATP
jgi:excisionase family DNA binding protein